jgi:hypothetical protein
MKNISITILVFTALAVLSSCKKHQDQNQGAPPTNLIVPFPDYFSAYLSWDSVPGAKSYVVRYQKAGATSWMMDTAVPNSLFPTFTWATIPTDSGANYEWQVQSIFTGGASAFSTSNLFYAGTPIGQWTYNGVAYTANTLWPDYSPAAMWLFDNTLNGITNIGFSFSHNVTQSGSYRVVSANGSAANNTMTVLYVPLLAAATFSSTGSDSISVNVTVANNQIGFAIPSVQMASASGSTTTITNIRFNQ